MAILAATRLGLPGGLREKLATPAVWGAGGTRTVKRGMRALAAITAPPSLYDRFSPALRRQGAVRCWPAEGYGEEEHSDRRRKLEDVLTRAVDFCGKAQSSRGGWYYTSAADGHDADEGSVTVTQVQALRAAKNAGIVVPKSVIDKSLKYLENSTTDAVGAI